MKKIAFALLVSAAISAPAFAADPFSSGVVGSKYAVVDLGSTSYGGNSATGISIGGGYQFHPAVALEIDYLMGGKYSYGIFGFNASTELNSLQFMAVGNYVINSDFTAYGKAGLAHNSYKTTTVLPFLGAVTATGSTNDLAFAIGAKYKINKDIAVRAQYQETGVSSVNVISIGAMFNF